MRLRVLSSGSKGNATLVRAGDLSLLVDAGLPARALTERLDAARVPFDGLDHVAVTHGHLDHARSSGVIARRMHATLHAAPALLDAPACKRARVRSALGADRPVALADARGAAALELLAVAIPHDATPTYAFRLDAGGRRAVVLTDMGRPDAGVARALAGAHLLVLEFNHDLERLRGGPYPAPLKRRVAGDRGHLSNDQAAEMLRALAGPELHTVVLAHLSEQNNAPELAVAAARGALEAVGAAGVRVVVAEQHAVGPELEV